MATLLSFHRSILEEIHDPLSSELLLIARGLGLRRVVCKLLQIYDSPQNLVILVNASQEEESAIGEELGIMGCRQPGLRIVAFETGRKDRQDLYKKGGLVSITSQILTVDMLTGDLPSHLITGIIMLHADRVTPTSAEAFIVRLYREKNTTGFLKAFSDDPEHITSGLSPLRTIMKELQLKKVHVYPRFHQDVIECLGRDRSVLQLTIDMTEYMSEIHGAIVQCMNTTLSELKRSNTSLDLDDLNVDNAYFRSFDVLVRRQLDPVWHKVGPRTKQLVSDLATLRRLLNYLLTYDALAFHAYLETLIESSTVNEAGNAKHNQSPWMLTDAAHLMFDYAKRRCYTISAIKDPAPQVHDIDNEDAWDALDEAEGLTGRRREAAKESETKRPHWLPKNMHPVLEELPKWSLVAAALQEIEEEMIRRALKMTFRDPGTNTVLIMTSSLRTSQLLSDFLSSMDPDAPQGRQGRKVMEDKLRLYLWWKARLGDHKQDGKNASDSAGRKASGGRRFYTSGKSGEGELSEALKKKDRERQARTANRRRVRGGAPTATPSAREGQALPVEGAAGDGKPADEADSIAEFLATQDVFVGGMDGDIDHIDFGADFDDNYGLLQPEQTILVRAFSDDSDEQMLNEIQPRYIIMFEPNLEFVRRVEVYKKANPGLGVRIYLLVYNYSCEEAKYLAGVRREKESFERLIKERGSMLMPIIEQRRAEKEDSLIKTISSRIAGGRKELNTEPSRVIVDIREFRSSLPSLLHASNLLVIPVTLTVGDYILTPDICVERKSIPDLISSFNSGRLYTQCEVMSAHYKQPILLIEWEEHKSFSLDTIADTKSYVKPTGKFPAKKKPAPGVGDGAAVASPLIQSKLVLLTLTFPRVRIIWSSSSYATAEIFKDLKTHHPEPDPTKAVVVGAEEDPDAGAGVNTTAEELLRALPGITSKNVKHVMSKCDKLSQEAPIVLRMSHTFEAMFGGTCVVVKLLMSPRNSVVQKSVLTMPGCFVLSSPHIMQKTEPVDTSLVTVSEKVIITDKSGGIIPQKDSLDAETATGNRKQELLIVDWNGPDDPENPRNWRASRKWVATILVALYAFASPAASSMISPASDQFDEKFGVTQEVVSQIVTSVFVLAYAFGPLILGPLSELFGRNIVLQCSNLWFLIFNIACGAAQNQGELITFRFLAGLGGGAPLAIGGGLIADCFDLDERGVGLSIFAIAPLLGPVLGPLTGAWVAEKASWRWVFWSTSILTGVIQIFGVIFIRETYAPVLLARRANRIRKSTDNEKDSPRDVQTIYDGPNRQWQNLIKIALVRPFVLFYREPIMQVLGVYMAFIYGLFYIFLTTLPTIFEGVYRQDIGIAGIHYIALGIGLVGGCHLCAFFQDKIYVRLQKQNDGVGKPEFRLRWTARANIHWIVPDIGLVFVGLGIIVPWLSINTYIIDAFTLYAASALATVMCLRSICGFGFPLFAPTMFDALGFGKADSILGAFAVLIGCPAPWLFWHFGERIRSASKYARK
ncbi:hypothetical protein EUX98_g3669 [Antrodiella citrinella]|uniref:Major facilitator superfamily (MFS) profile domain-containing protein n=1 Tax=Antrodiella citrinella TaxID=2447956 RepID=A0A4V3XIU2_9APHY|nr:hypothetical protein EUX98_g3669 [Antrodiella citrinella]